MQWNYKDSGYVLQILYNQTVNGQYILDRQKKPSDDFMYFQTSLVISPRS